MATHNDLGKLGEKMAVDFLIKKGHVILETNWVFDKAEVDIIAQKHLLMFVHAPMQYEVDEIIPSMSVGFHEFEQKFEVVCALSFSPPKSLPNRGVEEC